MYSNMNLLKHQEELLFSLKMAVKRHRTSEVIYKSEWLGDLPYGAYHWVEVDGEEIKPTSPDSLHNDLTLLAKIGALKVVKEVQLNDEDNHVYYELAAG